MNRALTMQARVDAYLAERRHLGFSLEIPGTMLHAFARFADRSGHLGPLTTAIVLDWVKGQARNATPAAWARRLEVLRPFAEHEPGLHPATAFPETALLRRAHRAQPHPTSP